MSKQTKTPAVEPAAAALIEEAYQEPDPTGPLETPAVVPAVSLEELNASRVKVADAHGNLLYLEASRGVYILRQLPKVG